MRSEYRIRAITALAFFLTIQLVGLFLRLLPLHPLPVDAGLILYGHTHTALTGWIGAALYLALLALLPPPAGQKKIFAVCWWTSQAGALGMLISFPLQGYKPIPIAFSSLVLLITYVYVWRFWRDGRQQREPAWSSLRWALFFQVLASLGPWSLGPLMVRFPHSNLIPLAVGLYLHFLLNGFFVFAVLALWLRWYADQGLDSRGRLDWLGWGCLPAAALTTLWNQPPVWVYVVAAAGALLQLWALAGLLPVLWRGLGRLRLRHAFNRVLLRLSLLSFALKLGIQALSLYPALHLNQNRHWQIGFLHLVFLGMVSSFLLAWLSEQGLLAGSRWGQGLFLAGVGCSEIWLLSQGLFQSLIGQNLPLFYPLLFAASALIPLGTLLLLLAQRGGQDEVIFLKERQA